jgi:hypothetical protein
MLTPAPSSLSEHAGDVREPPSARVRFANDALEGLWAKGWASRPTLDPDELVCLAAEKAGTSPDEDVIGWRDRLALLCADLADHAMLSALGRTIAHGQLVSALSSRFRAHALWRRYPQIAEQRIEAPIIIVGQMRSGTTRMHRLLACDPRFSFTRFFESWNPIPARGRRSLIDDRKLKSWFGLACARFLNPVFHAIHPTEWHAPDEEIGLQSLLIFGSAFEAQWRVPNYTAAIETNDPTAVYAEFRRLLQTLAWLRGDTSPRPWIMKVPQFTQDLPALLHHFPDARLIYLHRDPLEVVASSASLVFNQMRLQSDTVDAHAVGREWSRKVALREQRMATAKGALSAPSIEVAYQDVESGWEEQVRRVYDVLQLPFTDPVKADMAAYLARSAPHRRRQHHYDPHRFGLTPTDRLALAG